MFYAFCWRDEHPEQNRMQISQQTQVNKKQKNKNELISEKSHCKPGKKLDFIVILTGDLFSLTL